MNGDTFDGAALRSSRSYLRSEPPHGTENRSLEGKAVPWCIRASVVQLAIQLVVQLVGSPVQTHLHAQTTNTRSIANVVPANARVEQLVVTSNQQRTYYTPQSGGLWMYDRETSTPARVTDAAVWDLTMARQGNVIAYTKAGTDNRRQHFVWIQPLAPSTGLPNGAERQLSKSAGDVPSISPDGKWVAFARDDVNGVGQSVVVISITGGTERVVAAAQPSGIRSIQWTPDGRTLYFGINPPLPFTCAESCLALAREPRSNFGGIRRVAASGGAVTTIVSTNNPSPGLSPDGMLLVFGDTARPRGFVVAEVSGRRLDTLPVSAGHTPRGWVGPSTLLTSAPTPRSSMQAATLTAIDLSVLRSGKRSR